MKRVIDPGTAWGSCCAVMVFALALCLMPSAANAQEDGPVYRIGSGDVLQLNVPQLPALDGELNVQANGTVYVAQVGEVALAGLTLAEGEELLERRLQLFDPRVTDVVLGMAEYNALRVFALGAVVNAGPHTFEAPPTLWDVLRAAGGPDDNANLAACRIMAVVDGRPVSTTVDLSGYLAGTDLPDRLLRGGDTLIVPTIADGIVGVPASLGVQVFGGVRQPTTVPIQEPTELITVLMLSGAPLENARLRQVNWVHRSFGGQDTAVKVDMRMFLEEGSPVGNPLIHPGDVVYVPHDRPNWLQRNLPLMLTVSGTVTAAIIAYDRVANN